MVKGSDDQAGIVCLLCEDRHKGSHRIPAAGCLISGALVSSGSRGCFAELALLRFGCCADAAAQAQTRGQGRMWASMCQPASHVQLQGKRHAAHEAASFLLSTTAPTSTP